MVFTLVSKINVNEKSKISKISVKSMKSMKSITSLNLSLSRACNSSAASRPAPGLLSNSPNIKKEGTRSDLVGGRREEGEE